MTFDLLPASRELLCNPELASLALVRAAIDTADRVLNLTYADLGVRRHNVERHPEILIAAVLTQRFHETRQLLDMYIAATRRHRCDDLLTVSVASALNTCLTLPRACDRRGRVFARRCDAQGRSNSNFLTRRYDSAGRELRHQRGHLLESLRRQIGRPL
jgi:hypothetical protein